jgi:hypothetical protein
MPLYLFNPPFERFSLAATKLGLGSPLLAIFRPRFPHSCRRYAPLYLFNLPFERFSLAATKLGLGSPLLAIFRPRFPHSCRRYAPLSLDATIFREISLFLPLLSSGLSVLAVFRPRMRFYRRQLTSQRLKISLFSSIRQIGRANVEFTSENRSFELFNTNHSNPRPIHWFRAIFRSFGQASAENQTERALKRLIPISRYRLPCLLHIYTLPLCPVHL